MKIWIYKLEINKIDGKNYSSNEKEEFINLEHFFQIK